MSAIKRAVAQKIVAQQAEVIVAQDIPAEVAMPAVEKAFNPVQLADDPFEQMQNIALDAQHDLPVDLAQMAEEFHAQSIAFADQQPEGAVLLAQAAGKSNDGAAGAAQGDSDKGAAGDLASDDGGVLGDLGGGGIAALIGLGLIAAAGGGGGGGSGTTDETLVARNWSFTDLQARGYEITVPKAKGAAIAIGESVNNVESLNPIIQLGQDKIVSTFNLDTDNNLPWNGGAADTYFILQGSYNPANSQFTYNGTGNDFLIVWEGLSTANKEFGGVLVDLDLTVYTSTTLVRNALFA